MFKKILIANRGEIACRIIRTARRMGIASVAVYSDADRRMPFVAMADEAISLGPAPDAYLSIEAMLAACRASKPEAVHPGYGFLSENAAFAEAVAAAGLAFIGPNPRAIRLMGDKIAAKEIAEAAGVAVLPGYSGTIGDAKEAAAIAEAITYPVLLKPVAGGGGKGMRTVRAAREMASEFVRAQSEADSAFGDDRIFLEKYLDHPRHIEIQILADRFGNRIHLGERECSIQRRHQKIIEEAPSPFVDDEMRAAMARQALALAEAVDYDSAGTVEFLVDPETGAFFFLEMNTRLQVEHPVTESITGLDLVEDMIRIATGERLRYCQSDIAFSGWAVECRIYAEEPQRGFLPSEGRLTTLRPPQDRAGLRLDMGVIEGSEITSRYDPMLGKLVVHAADRLSAIAVMADALDQFVIEGVGNNLSFLSAMMQLPRFREGALSTDFIAQEFPKGFAPRAPNASERVTLAFVAAAIDHVFKKRERRGFPPADWTRAVFLGRERIDLVVEEEDVGLRIQFPSMGESRFCQSDWRPGQKLWAGAIDGESVFVKVKPRLNSFQLEWRGIALETCVLAPRLAELYARMPEGVESGRDRMIRAPMPGLVTAVLVTIGQTVAEGDPICILEAMKMETVVIAETAGIVGAIHATVGASVAVDAALLELV
jgi:propionyl-CoA carboxylase alpha chain